MSEPCVVWVNCFYLPLYFVVGEVLALGIFNDLLSSLSLCLTLWPIRVSAGFVTDWGSGEPPLKDSQ